MTGEQQLELVGGVYGAPVQAETDPDRTVPDHQQGESVMPRAFMSARGAQDLGPGGRALPILYRSRRTDFHNIRNELSGHDARI